MATHWENLEKSGNLKLVKEKSGEKCVIEYIVSAPRYAWKELFLGKVVHIKIFMSRAHSFPRAEEFQAEPQNLPFDAEV